MPKLGERLERILDGIADGITVQDRAGRIVLANTAAARQCGFDSVDELLAATGDEVVRRFEVLDEQGKPMAPQDLPGRRVMAGAESATTVMHVRERSSGREWWSSVRATGVLGADGKPEMAINIWHDVTEDRRGEQHDRYLADAMTALSSSLDYDRMLATLAGLLVPGLADWCAIDLLEGGRLRNVAVAHVDPAKVAFAREIQERYPTDLEQPHGVASVLRTGKSELHADIPDELLAQGAHDAAHLELLRRVGIRSVILAPIRIRDRVSGVISLIASAEARRFDGRDVALVEELGRRAGTSIENAKLYAAERRAREQLEIIARAGAAFSGAADYEETLGIVAQIALPALGDFAFFDVVEDGGEVRRVAAAHDDPEVDALIKQTRWVRSERTDKNLCALSSGEPGFHPLIDDAWRQDIAGSPEHLDLLRKLHLGSMVTVPLRARGRVLGALTVCFGKSGRRHTEEDLHLAEELARRAGVAVVQARLYEEAQAAAKRAEEAAARAEEANRIKDEFLATVSHELRTPLNAIVGWSALLRDRSEDPFVVKGIDVIHRNSQSQAKIIEDILDVSRIITGKLRLELEATDLEAMVRDAIEVVGPSAAAKGIAIDLESPSEPCVLVGDPERLQQVVWNLLSNAVKFTDPGGTVTISITKDRSQAAISVTDTGRGISADFLPYVFDRFKQADSSATRRVGGLGLGLAIVRHIVELHGGQVHALSGGLDAGSSFTVTFPMRAALPAARDGERPSSRMLEAATDSGSLTLRGLRFLVVDDEPDARELVETVLAHAGGTVETAASAAEGFDRLQRFRPHVLVSDIGMPDQDGYDLIRRVRALDAALGGDTPSIALTAYTRSEDKTKALSSGFTTHLAKPIDPADLLAAVARALNRPPAS